MIDPNNLHHAYLILGNRERLKTVPEELFEVLEINQSGNPDIFIIESESFGVEDARMFTQKAEMKAFGTKKLLFAIVDRITIEAQNALLKTLEEPPENTHFFILTSDELSLLPTLLSRVQKLRLGNKLASNKEVYEFLKLSYKDRLVFAKTFADEERNLSSFIDNLLVYLREQNKIEDVKSVYKVGLFANDRSKSSRLILEHLALVLE